MNWLLRSLLLTALALIASAALAIAREPVQVDFRCLTTEGDRPIRLEWRLFSEAESNWTSAYIRYKGAKRVIPLVLRSTHSTPTEPGRPFEFRSVWLEVVDGKISGEYAVTSQGANIYDFVYKNYKSGKEVSFSQDNEAFQESKCQWN